MACVAVTLLSCQKEAPVVPEEETPEVQPIPAPEENVLVYHAGIGDPETKTTLYGTKNIFWKTGDKILAKVDGTYESFTLNEGDGTASGTFTYSGTGSALVGDAAAFYGYNIGETGGFSVTDGTHVTLPDTYAWSSQGLQAPMMDADGTSGAGNFSLMGAVLKVDVENIPAAANKLVFTATGKNISGAYEVTSEELVLTDGSNSTITITFTAGEATSRTFFIPLPTGTYDVVCPVTIQNNETVLYTKNIKANGLVLSKGALMYVPAISAEDVAASSSTTVWSGSHSLGSWNSLYVNQMNDDVLWGLLRSGAKVKVTFTPDPEKADRILLQNSFYRELPVSGLDYYPTDSDTEYEFSLKTAALDSLAATGGLRITGENATITKVEVIASSYETTTTTLFTGEHALGNWQANSIDYDFRGVASGSVLKVTMNAPSGTNVQIQDKEWHSIYTNKAFQDTGDGVVMYHNLGLRDLDSLKSVVRVTGVNATITKVELIEKVIPESVLWTGSLSTGNWENQVSDLTSSFWTSLTPGKIVTVYFNAAVEGSAVIIQKGDWTDIDGLSASLSAGATSMKFRLNKDMVDAFKDGGIHVKGNDITITKITLK